MNRSTEKYISEKTILVHQTQPALSVSPSFCLQPHYFFRFDIPCGKAVKTSFLLAFPSMLFLRPVITMIAVSFFIPKDWAAGELVFGEVWKAAPDIFLACLILVFPCEYNSEWNPHKKQVASIPLAALLVQHDLQQDEVINVKSTPSFTVWISSCLN